MKKIMVGVLLLTASLSAFSGTYCYSSQTYNRDTGKKIIRSEIKLENGYVKELNILGHKLIQSSTGTIENKRILSQEGHIIQPNLIMT